jgi:tellurite resistance protein
LIDAGANSHPSHDIKDGHDAFTTLGFALYRNSKAWRLIRQSVLALILATGWCSAPIGTFEAHAQSVEVQKAQETLKTLGYDVGKADGFIGPHTRAALKAYQSKKGLNSSGELDASTIQTLDAETSSPPPIERAPVTASSDDSGSVLFWLFLIAGGIVWFFARKGKAQRSASQNSRPTFVSQPQYKTHQSTTSYPITDTSLNRWTSSGANLEAKLAEESQKCWVPLGQEVVVSGLKIGGGVYVGPSLHRQDGSNGDNCLIDPSLKVSSTQANIAGANMPYWPSYSLINPECRRAYLQWLSEGKNEPSAYIGYVFLYFYGLERRLMLDNAGKEAGAIYSELQRLHALYSANHSFNSYATTLLSAAAVKYQQETKWPPLSLKKVTWQLPLDLLVAIGSTVGKGIALDAFQMLTWYNAHPEKRLPPLAARCPEEFKSLFKTRFEAKFPQGMMVSPPKRTLSATYRAASSTFSVNFHVGATAIPDVSGLTAPLNAIDSVIAACAADLTTYARLIGKDRSARSEMAAAAALPAQLLSEGAGGPIMRLKCWLDSRVTGGATAIQLRELLAQVGADVRVEGKATKADLILIADALSRCGFGIEPDPAIAYPSTTNATEAIVFRSDGGARLAHVSPEFLGALAQIDIGMIVATAGNKLASTEVELLASKVSSNPNLSSFEKDRLVARLAFLSKYPPTTRIFAKFKDRPVSDREAVARLALSVAAADGTISVEEARTLEKLYKTLDLPTGRLYSDIQNLNIADDQPPIVALGEPAKSVPIRPKPKSGPNPNALDPSRLAKTRADTAIVSTILSEIFSDHDGPPAKDPIVNGHAPAVAGAEAGPDRFPGLDPKYVSLLTALVAHKGMDKGDFEVLTGSHNLMCDGAIEAINDWSYGRFDGPILDDGPHIMINNEILNLAEGHS